MKKFYFVLLGFCYWHVMNGQELHIPDLNFKTKLLSASADNRIAKNSQGEYVTIDRNTNGKIEATEARAVSYLNLSSSSIADLTGIEYFTGLTSLICNDNQISTLDTSTLTLLATLQCSNNRISSLDLSSCPNLYSLSCTKNELVRLVLDNPNLNFINCQYNQLASLDFSGSPSVEYIYVSYNLLNDLNLSGCNRIRDLECTNNKLVSLDVSGRTTLRDLKCNNNRLVSLDFTGCPIKELHCGYNQLTALDLSGATDLEYLNCSNNELRVLDFSRLRELKQLLAQNNQLTTMNDILGFAELKTVLVDNNRLQSLRVSAPMLAQLSIENNQLNSLSVYGCPELSFTRGLNFRNNPLSLLDVRGYVGLTAITCNNYGLTNALTVLADSEVNSISFNNNRLTSLDISQCLGAETLSYTSNPLLASLFIKNGKNNQSSVSSALLTVPSLRYICADEGEEVTQIQDIITGRSNFSCEVNSYCSFVPGGRYYTVRAKTTFDANTNGCDANDLGVPITGYKVTNGTTEVIYMSDESGAYDLPLLSGNSVITPLLTNPSYYDVSPSNASFTFSEQDSPQEQRFCVSPKKEYSDLEIVMLPMDSAIPGYASNYKIVYKNKGTSIQSGTVELHFDPEVLRLEHVFPAAISQESGHLSWAFSNLMPFESQAIVLRFVLNTPMDVPALNNDDILDYVVSVTSPALDLVPEDNVAVFRQKVVNSFDPNDKTCLQGDTIGAAAVGQYVNYIVRFENRGTANAQNIVIKDRIDTNSFDMTSLVLVEGSHPFTTKINGNTIEFVFKDIDLPFYDNINDGYIAFKIKTKPSLSVGDQFSNKASIYFDFNLPIMTDSAITTIESLERPDIEFSNRFSLYPNPSKGILNIAYKDDIRMKSVSIYNMMGQPVLVFPNTDNAKTLDISDLASGNYVIKIFSDTGSTVGKFVKE